MDEQNRILAGLILNCQPEDLKAISMRVDGSLAVVAPNGMKFIFSPVELENARDSFGLQEASNVAMLGASMPGASTGSANGEGSTASTTSTGSVIGASTQQNALNGASAGSATSTPTQQKALCGADAGSAASTCSAGGHPKAELVEAGRQSSVKNRRQESRL